ncbi:hypothetical protein Tco_0362016, partial [Tanacetum coccineum]
LARILAVVAKAAVVAICCCYIIVIKVVFAKVVVEKTVVAPAALAIKLAEASLDTNALILYSQKAPQIETITQVQTLLCLPALSLSLPSKSMSYCPAILLPGCPCFVSLL